MAKPPDMSMPVTRAELHEDLAKYPTKVDLREELAKYPTKAELREELAKYPTKVDLREELAKYPTKVDLREELAKYATKVDLRDELSKLETKIDTKFDLWGGALLARMTELETRLRSDLRTEWRADLDWFGRELRAEIHLEFAAQLRLFEEFTRSMIVAINEPYRDLPPRVTRLENRVFAPKRKRR